MMGSDLKTAQPVVEAALELESMPAPEPPRFPPDRLAFFQRIAEGNLHDREAGAIARAHLMTLTSRILQAARAVELGHLGSARAFLEIGRRDFEAALRALPEL